MKQICISHNVSKLGSDIPAISMPVGISCRPDAPCFAKCYARKGNMARKNVKDAYMGNYEAYKEDPVYFFDYIAINTRLNRFFRWHSAGDIVDARYLQGMVDVANKNPETKYLAFTKKIELVNAYMAEHGAFPKNLTIVLSAWGASFKAINPNNLPVAYIKLKQGDCGYIPEDAIPCGSKCHECLGCWQLREGQSVYFNEH